MLRKLEKFKTIRNSTFLKVKLLSICVSRRLKVNLTKWRCFSSKRTKTRQGTKNKIVSQRKSRVLMEDLCSSASK